MNHINNPKVIKNFLPELVFDSLKNYLMQKEKTTESFDPAFGRYIFNDSFVNKHFDIVTEIAKDVFGSKTLLPSYALFAHYEGNKASLFAHLDDNACTYTLDMCVYQTEPWDLYVDGKPYTLNENEALAYYGNDQKHGREKFPNPESQHVAMIFFHFVEPDHWWFTKGPEYLNVIRENI
jgi:hypothetical protein